MRYSRSAVCFGFLALINVTGITIYLGWDKMLNLEVHYTVFVIVHSLRCTVENQWLEHKWLVYHGYFELVLKSYSCRHFYVWDNLE